MESNINISENIIVGSRLFPDRDAILFEDQRLTYGQVERLSAHAAQVLCDRGIERGDRVGIVLANVPAFVVWYYACLRLGAIAVSVSTRLTGEEVAFIVSDCEARIVVGPVSLAESMQADCVDQILLVSDDGLFVSDGFSETDRSQSGLAPRFDRSQSGLAPRFDGSQSGLAPRFDGSQSGLAPRFDRSLESCGSVGEGFYEVMEPDEPATILYTSGTTGFPKGATLSHRNVVATVLAFNHLCGMRSGDCLLLSVPLFHCYGQNALLNSGLHAGATIVLQRRFDLSESKRLIRDRQVTMLFGVPMTFQLMLESCDADDLNSIRYCFSAAAKLPEQLSHAWFEKFRMPVFEGYGLTETAPFASYNHRLEFVPGSIGTPVDLVEMKIVDPDSGEICPPGTPGEIAIRGPNVMLGYWNRPEETAAAIRDGWFYSGDIGKTDERGFFYIVDRLKDMIVIGALKVFPAEVERVLLGHPAVEQAAVVGFQDDVLGEKVVAFIVRASVEPGCKTQSRPDTRITEHELRSYCGQHLGSYKVPRQIVIVDELPRNPAGKVLKTKLREYELPSAEPTPLRNGSEITSAFHSPPGESSLGEERGKPSPTAETSDPERKREDVSSKKYEVIRVQAQSFAGSGAVAGVSGPLIQRLRETHPASRLRLLMTFLQDELQALSGRDEPPDVDELILDADVDSLMIVELRDRLQAQVGDSLPLAATLVFDHPKISDLAEHLLSSLDQDQAMERSSDEQSFRETACEQDAQQIEDMSEQQAMEALLREVND